MLKIEGFLEMQPNGKYLVGGEHELTSGESIRIKMSDDQWLPMRMEHDGETYYLTNGEVSFYPKRMFVRYESSRS
ncbi:hypothetical protein EDC14_102159 [Hydrogenispora ethanolica]|jgi:hypothetical protein|uniref:DUF5348 domain-containing protein n=1 Tax=Hydrogenispora ethanolica TaxID=1082276 RepID=A0A4R1RBZ8_HYDET|nr:DUF5348 domain-containing protein [Hydrogenispora ethanolica]TCL63341.1 hypothetical protein EDC14_102159 [Hydrogenispora ethanolica]